MANNDKSGANRPTHSHTPIEYLTRKDVSKLLNASLPTVDRWAAIGMLKSYRIGNFVRFKRHEIDAALTLIPAKNKGVTHD